MQQSFFEVNKRFECIFFYQIGIQVTTNLSSRLEKHQMFFLMTDFYDCLKNAHFLHLPIFVEIISFTF